MTGEPLPSRDSWVRAFEVAIDETLDPTPTTLTADEIAHDERAILARLRAVPEAAPRRRPLRIGLRELRIVVSGVPLTTLVLLVALSAVSPTTPLALLLFVVAPAALLLKWGIEAYCGGHELRRDGELLGERAHEFRLLRRRLDVLVETLDGAPASESRADLTAAVVAVRERMRSVADRLRLGSRGARAFAARWRDEPDEACDRLAPQLDRLEPHSVDAALRDLLHRLARVLPLTATLPVAESRMLVNEVDEIRRVVAHGQAAIVRECRQLYRSFDPVHRGAVRRVLRRRLPWRLAPASLAGLAGTTISTFDPVARNRRRTHYLRAVEDRRTLAGIGRATVHAVREEAA